MACQSKSMKTILSWIIGEFDDYSLQGVDRGYLGHLVIARYTRHFSDAKRNEQRDQWGILIYCWSMLTRCL